MASSPSEEEGQQAGGATELETRLHRLSMSHHQDAAEDGGDPFEDFEELEDSKSAPTSTSTPTTPAADAAPAPVEEIKEAAPPPPEATPATNRASADVSKFIDDGDDWDEGVDARDDQVFDAPVEKAQPQASQSTAYVRSKIQELATVQEQAESTQDNPAILNALRMVLEAMKQQIEKAYDGEKINQEEHQQIMDRLHSVRELIASK